MRVIITLACTQCNRRNYTTSRNRRTGDTSRLELKKYCRFCRTHTVHRETR